MLDFLTHVAGGVLEFIFPKSEKIIELESLPAADILKTLPSAESTGDDDIIALFDYHHPLSREMIWELKYRGNRTVAGKLADILKDVIDEELAERALFQNFLPGMGEAVLLVPMPISDKRRNERGYNQVEILAEEIKKRDAQGLLKYVSGQLVKHRHTESQTLTATKAERLENVKGSMHVIHPPAVAGRMVIVLDDVTTTGASFTEAKRALKDAGAKKVICLAAAH